MGAWDATSFGNDTACDWLGDFTEEDDLSIVEAAFQTILDVGDEYLDSDEALQGIAAAEVLAWLRGHPAATNAYTEKLARWVAAHPVQPPTALTQKALSALDRIERPPSELPDLWEGNPEWLTAMSDLRTRLSG